MEVSELDTPALIVDLDLMERNIKEMADWCRAHNINLRPHMKPIKVPAIAHMLIEAGAKGICLNLHDTLIGVRKGRVETI